MKRITVTPEITTLVQNALGNDVNLANMAIYEAIAFNTLPIRKKHPLYLNARAEPSLLYEMAAALNTESRPLQINHKTDEDLPKGRVFHGEVVSNGLESELRVLFYVDGTEAETIAKVDSGTVDQVSVSVLSKQILNSKSGFDYLGPKATFENVWTGEDPDGNKINKDGVYAILKGLDLFLEMSLVGQGGAQNARIVHRDQSHFGSSFTRLAASGLDPNVLVLTATPPESPENTTMDMTQFLAELTSKTTDLANSTAQVTTLTATNAQLTTDLTAVRAELDDLKTGDVATLTAAKVEGDAAITALKGVATHLLTAAGKPATEVPNTVAELNTLIESTKATLVAALVTGGKALPTDSGKDEAAPRQADLSAFQPRR